MSTALPDCAPGAQELVRLLSAPEGSRDWAQGMRYEIQSQAGRAGADPGYVAQCLGALLRSRGWRLLRTARGTPFRSFLRLCRARRPYGLGLRPAEVEAFVRLLGSSHDRPHP
jgi:hypothetical protein